MKILSVLFSKKTIIQYFLHLCFFISYFLTPSDIIEPIYGKDNLYKYRGDRKMPVCEKIDSFKGLPIIVPYGTPQDEIDRFLKSGFEVIIAITII